MTKKQLISIVCLMVFVINVLSIYAEPLGNTGQVAGNLSVLDKFPSLKQLWKNRSDEQNLLSSDNEQMQVDSSDLFIEDGDPMPSEDRYNEQKTNRFIVKYKEGSSSEQLSVNTMGKLNAKKQEKRQIIKNEKVRAAGKPGKQKRLTISLIELNEKMEKSVFEETIRASEDMSQIEYIQPDYKLRLSDIVMGTVDVDLGEEASEKKAQQNEQETAQIEEPETSQSEENIQEPVINEPEESSREPVNPFDLEGNLNAAFQISTGQGSIIALIDTAVDISHSQLDGHLVEGWDFVNDQMLNFNPDKAAIEYHGTHVAGIIAKSAPGAKIMPLKVFEKGTAYTSDIIDAIQFAEANGASIVNCSWGSGNENLALKEAMENSNMFFVAAAGNSRTNLDETGVYPAAYGLNNLISVGSINDDGGISFFSNYGTMNVNIAAWGREVESLLPNNKTGRLTGTSVATAFVSGAAALVVSSDGSASGLKVKLMHSADKLSCLESKITNGNVVNFSNAVNGLAGNVITTTPVDDFDIYGYERTPEESWELFCSLDNKQIVSGSSHTLVLKQNGTVWAWGDNNYGQLGNGTYSTGSSVPVQVMGLGGYVEQIAVGNYCNIAIGYGQYGKTVWTWGEDSIADNPCVPQAIPVDNPAKVVSGGYHCGVIDDNGTLTILSYYWNYATTLTNVKDASISTTYCLAIKNDNSAYVIGNSSYTLGLGSITNIDTLTLIPGLPTVSEVFAGPSHCMAIGTDGNLWVWGSNSYGKLGLGDFTNRDTPQQITTLTDVISISVGTTHSLAVTQDGRAWAWGRNNYGQLGDGTTYTRTSPIRVIGFSTMDRVAAVSAGNQTSMFMKEDTTIYGTGYNNKGQLGVGNTVNYSIPTKVSSSGGDVIGNDIYETHNLPIGQAVYSSIDSMSDVDCFQLISDEFKKYAITVRSGLDIKARVDMYDYDGNLVASNVYENPMNDAISILTMIPPNMTLYVFVYGNGSETGSYSILCQKVTSSFSYVEAGLYHTLALKYDGTVWAWGRNNYGQLGNGTTTDKYYPVQVYQNDNQPLDDVVFINAGGDTSFAIKTDGTLWAWGKNTGGQLGDGTFKNQTRAVQITALEGMDVAEVSAGANHTLVRTSDGVLYGMGNNLYGNILPNGNTIYGSPVQILTNISAAAAGMNFSIAVAGDTIKSWGQNNNGQLGIGHYNVSSAINDVYLPGVRKIAAGSGHVLALMQDGTVYSWGINNAGQLGYTVDEGKISTPNPVPELEYVVDISAGLQHSLATVYYYSLEVWAWGRNTYGQLGNNTQTNVFEPQYIMPLDGPNCSAGGYFSMAYSAGMLCGTGSNQDGQIGTGKNTGADFQYKQYTYVVDYIPDGAQEDNGNISVTAGDTCIITAFVSNATDFDNKVFVLSYESDMLNVTDLVVQQYGNETEKGIYGNIEIIEIIDVDEKTSNIKFKVLYTPIEEGTVWSGTINIFKFMAAKSGTCSVKLSVQ